MIAEQSGLGKDLAKGTDYLAQLIGNGAEQFLTSVKGLSVPAYDPRAGLGVALSYMIGPGGANHRKAFFSPETKGIDNGSYTPEKAGQVAAKAIEANANNCLGLCKWGSGKWHRTGNNLSRLAQAVLGEDITQNLNDLGQRILTMHRLFNARQGYGRNDDRLPPRFFQPRFEGEAVPDPHILNLMLSQYYQAMGWDEQGVPLSETIAQLGLESFV